MAGMLPGSRHSEETKAKIGLSATGRTSGYRHTAEAKAKMSQAKIGNNYGLGYRHTDVTKAKMSRSLTGLKRSAETKAKIRRARVGRKASDATKAKNALSSTGRKYSAETRAKIALSKKGCLSHFWKGGITPVHKLIRSTREYSLWRKAVFERDEYRCLGCDEGSRKLEAHHIYPFSIFPLLRCDVTNGQTLCRECHRKLTNAAAMAA